MKTLPTQARALVKRQSLLDAAIAQFSTIGFELATAKSIATSAKVATGTFYQYFENKNDILRVLASNRLENLHAHVKAFEMSLVDSADISAQNHSVEQKFYQTLLFVYQFHARDPALHQVLEHRRTIDLDLKEIMSNGEKVLQNRILNFVNSFNLADAQQVSENLFAMSEGLVHHLVFHSEDLTQQQIDRSLKVGAKMLSSFFSSTQNE